jgi:predicted DNA-binding transcriptional regulator AlpA
MTHRDSDRILGFDEAAIFLGMSRRSLYRKIAQGKIESVKGVRESAVAAYLGVGDVTSEIAAFDEEAATA